MLQERVRTYICTTNNWNRLGVSYILHLLKKYGGDGVKRLKCLISFGFISVVFTLLHTAHDGAVGGQYDTLGDVHAFSLVG